MMNWKKNLFNGSYFNIYIKLILLLFNEGKKLINRGKQIEDFLGPDIITGILRLSRTVPNENFEQIEAMKNLLLKRLKSHQ